jgi:hypothetical protein
MISEKEHFKNAVANISKFFASNGDDGFLKQSIFCLQQANLKEQSEKLKKIYAFVNIR